MVRTPFFGSAAIVVAMSRAAAASSSVGHASVHETYTGGLVAIDLDAGEEQLLRLVRADEAGQAHG